MSLGSALKKIGGVALQVGKVAGKVALAQMLPGSAGIIQQVETLLGPGTGATKKQAAIDLAKALLEAKMTAGQITDIPNLDAIAKEVQDTVDKMQKDGTLIEANKTYDGMLVMGGESFIVLNAKKLLEDGD